MNRRVLLQGAFAGAALGALGACTRATRQPLVVGAHPFPGYEFVHLAQHLGLLDAEVVHLIDTPSASANLRALAAEAMEGAGLTLDEVLTAHEQGMDLVVVCVVDRSLGTDAVLGGPQVRTLGDLAGRSIGVERSATGAVMLEAALAAAGLAERDVHLASIPFDELEAQFLAGKVDAIVTYDPVRTRLLAQGATELYSSTAIPGRIMDTLAIRRAALAAKPAAVRAWIDAHFAGLEAWRTAPTAHAEVLAGRLDLEPGDVPAAFAGLELPDRAHNRDLFADGAAALRESATALGDAMIRARLLSAMPNLDRVFDGSYL